jgi:putative ABC transport system ATP-binding protein
MQSGQSLLTGEGLTLVAGGVQLREGISFTLQKGERVAVAGPSGSGKTTLLRAVCGLDDPGAGTVRLLGKTPEEWSWPAFRRRVLLMEQRPTLLEESVEASLRRPFSYRVAAGQAFPRERAQALLERLGVGQSRMTQNARALSVGQQQRVCLIRALLLQPDVLLLDEPTSALDPQSVQLVEALLDEEAQARGLAALVVTHDPRQANEWCHRRLELGDFPVGSAT